MTAKAVSTEYEKLGGTVERAIVTVSSASGTVPPLRSKNNELAFDLAPGKYTVQFTGNGSRGATFEPTMKKVTVKAGDATRPRNR